MILQKQQQIHMFFVYFQQLVNLFARLATDNIGYIDWDPYVPKVIENIWTYITALTLILCGLFWGCSQGQLLTLLSGITPACGPRAVV